MLIKLTALCRRHNTQDEIWNVTSQHNMFCSCSGGSCEWEDEDEEDQAQDYSITFLTPSNFSSVASLHWASIHLSIVITLFFFSEKKNNKKTPSSYFKELITAEQIACLSPGRAGIIFSHYYICARSRCSSPEAPQHVMEPWRTRAGPIQINCLVCLDKRSINSSVGRIWWNKWSRIEMG